MATFIQSFKDRLICIPLIQRDYVQAISTDIIESFVEQLIDVLSDTSCSNTMNLNYVYGIDKPNAQLTEFEPVDGQQRLTTLWLFCLYISRRLNLLNVETVFDIKIMYKSREYAGSFCSEIIRHKTWAKHTDDLEKQIMNQNWFIPDWHKDTSVYAMIKALAVIARKLNRFDKNGILYIWKRLNDTSCPVTFSFYPTDTLGDDIYIKMNGRGRSLTSFENLKSWMDERLNHILYLGENQANKRKGAGEQFFQKWKNHIDNAWTNLFWSNRESGSFEIDEMQLRFFYNLVYLYWSLQDKKLILPENCDIEELSILLNLDPENTGITDLTDAILSKIIKSSNYSLPLYMLDKVNLCPLKFFLWFHKVMDGLCAINHQLKSITDNEIYFWGRSYDKENGISRTLLFQIMMSESGQDSVSMEKLALCYALCKYACFHNKTVTPLEDWLYRCRNLILNNSFSSKNFEKALQGISFLFESCMESHIDIVLKQDDFRINQFPEKYIRLEQYKSEILTSGNTELAAAMKKLENKRFFTGSILCVPLLIASKEAIENPSKFVQICEMTSSLLNSEGPKSGDKFRRALLYFSEPSIGYGGWEQGNIWSFLKGKYDWQWFFNDTETDRKIRTSNRKALKGLVDYLLNSKTHDYEQCINDLISTDSKIHDKYPVLDTDDWRYPFIYNAKVLEFMHDKCCRRNLPYDIVLSKSTVIRTNTDHVSLQIYLLYQEYKDGIRPLADKWGIELYKRENSCVVFRKNDIRITVEFISGKNKANAYSIRVYLNNEETHDIEDSRLKTVIGSLSADQYLFSESEGIRINGLTRNQVTDHLLNLMS